MHPRRTWNSLAAAEIGTMREAAFCELEGEAQRSVVSTSNHFVRELERAEPTAKTGLYGISIGVKSQHIIALLMFLQKHIPKFMRHIVFDINTPGMDKLVRQTGCLFFVRLDLSIPLAMALLLPELEGPKL